MEYLAIVETLWLMEESTITTFSYSLKIQYTTSLDPFLPDFVYILRESFNVHVDKILILFDHLPQLMDNFT